MSETKEREGRLIGRKEERMEGERKGKDGRREERMEGEMLNRDEGYVSIQIKYKYLN